VLLVTQQRGFQSSFVKTNGHTNLSIS
jgi:hypothetical protein